MVNYGPDAVEVPARVTLPDGSEITAFVELVPGGEAEERFTIPPEVPGGVAVVAVEDPDLPVDDARYFHLPRVGADRVMVVDGDPGATSVRSEVYFLERALAPWGGTRPGVLPEVTALAGLGGLDADDHKVLFLANVADPGGVGAAITEFVRGGGGLVISMGDNVTPDRYNSALRDLLPAPLRKTRSLVDLGAERGVPLTLPDTSLTGGGGALFLPFARAGRSAFTRLRARKVMTLAPYTDSEDVTTWLRYEGGVPALVERRVGRGRVLLWTSSLDADWGNAPLQSAYMPLIQRLVSYLGGAGGSAGGRVEGVVGDPLIVELPGEDEEPQVLGPDGEAVPAEVRRGDGITLTFVPRLPGGYTVGREGAPPLALVAVNTPPEESDVRVYERLREVEADIDPEAWLQRTDLGRWALALALALLLLQALMAARQRQGGAEPVRAATRRDDEAA